MRNQSSGQMVVRSRKSSMSESFGGWSHVWMTWSIRHRVDRPRCHRWAAL